MAERKGVMTADQEKILDNLIEFDNKIVEAADGLAITLIDNKGIEILKDKLEAKYPGASEEFVYPIIDAIFEGLKSIADSK